MTAARSRATCAIGRPLSATSRTGRSRSSSGYFFGAGIIDQIPFHQKIILFPHVPQLSGGSRHGRR
jgi:hypothetical protein